MSSAASSVGGPMLPPAPLVVFGHDFDDGFLPSTTGGTSTAPPLAAALSPHLGFVTHQQTPQQTQQHPPGTPLSFQHRSGGGSAVLSPSMSHRSHDPYQQQFAPPLSPPPQRQSLSSSPPHHAAGTTPLTDHYVGHHQHQQQMPYHSPGIAYPEGFNGSLGLSTSILSPEAAASRGSVMPTSSYAPGGHYGGGGGSGFAQYSGEAMFTMNATTPNSIQSHHPASAANSAPPSGGGHGSNPNASPLGSAGYATNAAAAGHHHRAHPQQAHPQTSSSYHASPSALELCPDDLQCAQLNQEQHYTAFRHTCRLRPCLHVNVPSHACYFDHDASHRVPRASPMPHHHGGSSSGVEGTGAGQPVGALRPRGASTSSLPPVNTSFATIGSGSNATDAAPPSDSTVRYQSATTADAAGGPANRDSGGSLAPLVYVATPAVTLPGWTEGAPSVTIGGLPPSHLHHGASSSSAATAAAQNVTGRRERFSDTGSNASGRGGGGGGGRSLRLVGSGSPASPLALPGSNMASPRSILSAGAAGSRRSSGTSSLASSVAVMQPPRSAGGANNNGGGGAVRLGSVVRVDPCDLSPTRADDAVSESSRTGGDRTPATSPGPQGGLIATTVESSKRGATNDRHGTQDVTQAGSMGTTPSMARNAYRGAGHHSSSVHKTTPALFVLEFESVSRQPVFPTLLPPPRAIVATTPAAAAIPLSPPPLKFSPHLTTWNQIPADSQPAPHLAAGTALTTEATTTTTTLVRKGELEKQAKYTKAWRPRHVWLNGYDFFYAEAENVPRKVQIRVLGVSRAGDAVDDRVPNPPIGVTAACYVGALSANLTGGDGKPQAPRSLASVPATTTATSDHASSNASVPLAGLYDTEHDLAAASPAYLTLFIHGVEVTDKMLPPSTTAVSFPPDQAPSSLASSSSITWGALPLTMLHPGLSGLVAATTAANAPTALANIARQGGYVVPAPTTLVFRARNEVEFQLWYLRLATAASDLQRLLSARVEMLLRPNTVAAGGSVSEVIALSKPSAPPLLQLLPSGSDLTFTNSPAPPPAPVAQQQQEATPSAAAALAVTLNFTHPDPLGHMWGLPMKHPRYPLPIVGVPLPLLSPFRILDKRVLFFLGVADMLRLPPTTAADLSPAAAAAAVSSIGNSVPPSSAAASGAAPSSSSSITAAAEQRQKFFDAGASLHPSVFRRAVLIVGEHRILIMDPDANVLRCVPLSAIGRALVFHRKVSKRWSLPAGRPGATGAATTGGSATAKDPAGKTAASKASSSSLPGAGRLSGTAGDSDGSSSQNSRASPKSQNSATAAERVAALSSASSSVAPVGSPVSASNAHPSTERPERPRTSEDGDTNRNEESNARPEEEDHLVPGDLASSDLFGIQCCSTLCQAMMQIEEQTMRSSRTDDATRRAGEISRPTIVGGGWRLRRGGEEATVTCIGLRCREPEHDLFLAMPQRDAVMLLHVLQTLIDVHVSSPPPPASTTGGGAVEDYSYPLYVDDVTNLGGPGTARVLNSLELDPRAGYKTSILLPASRRPLARAVMESHRMGAVSVVKALVSLDNAETMLRSMVQLHYQTDADDDDGCLKRETKGGSVAATPQRPPPPAAPMPTPSSPAAPMQPVVGVTSKTGGIQGAPGWPLSPAVPLLLASAASGGGPTPLPASAFSKAGQRRQHHSDTASNNSLGSSAAAVRSSHATTTRLLSDAAHSDAAAAYRGIVPDFSLPSSLPGATGASPVFGEMATVSAASPLAQRPPPPPCATTAQRVSPNSAKVGSGGAGQGSLGHHSAAASPGVDPMFYLSPSAPNATAIVVSFGDTAVTVHGDWRNVRLHTLRRYLYQVFGVRPQCQELRLKCTTTSTGTAAALASSTKDGLLLTDDMADLVALGVRGGSSGTSSSSSLLLSVVSDEASKSIFSSPQYPDMKTQR